MKKISAEKLANWYNWLILENCGCRSMPFYTDEGGKEYCFVMGFSRYYGDGWTIQTAVKHHSYNDAMACDFDIDFLYPSDENGEVFDNSFTVCSYDDFEELADYLNEQAAYILDDYEESDILSA